MTNLPDKGSAYTPHSTIRIFGNADFTPANGVSGGTGTAEDPFIIEGWDINAASGAGAGIQILYTDAHFIIRDSFIHGPGKMSAARGIILQGASNGTIQNTTLTGLETGIYTDYANNTEIAKNNITNNFWPVRAKHSTNLTFTRNTMSDQEYGIVVLQSYRVEATGNTIITPSQGIFLQQTPLSLVKRNNIISFSQFGIHIYFSDNSTVIENNLTDKAGISVEYSSNIAISNNSAPIGSDSVMFAQFAGNISITNNSVSTIACFHCWDALIADNAVSSKNYSGISYRYSDRAVIARNKVSNSSQGIYLEKAVNTTIMNNTITSNGITLRGDALAEFRSHVITVDNLVNGKPVYYYRDCNGLSVDGIQLGQLIVVNCTGVGVANLLINDTDTAVQMAYVRDVIVEKLNLTSNKGEGLFVYNADNMVIRNNDMSGNLEKGAELLDLSNATIEGNVFSGNGEGVFARVVDGNLSANVASGNSEHGISVEASRSVIWANHADQNGYWGMTLSYSANTRIEGNELSSNGEGGLDVESSHQFVVVGNNVSNNPRGIALGMRPWSPPDYPPYNVSLHDNSLINNTIQAIDGRGPENSWDDGYPNGGNYWSNYTGVDNCSGPNQDICPDPDGIGDTPLIIDFNSRDNYPIMGPYIPPPPDTTPPTIVGPQVPSPFAEVLTEVNITAWVTDNVVVEHVWLNISGPGGFGDNVSMMRGSGDIWYFSRVYDILGTYDATVWAFDPSGNCATDNGEFDVVDSIPPDISNASAEPPRQKFGGEVDISANVTDNFDLASVKVELISPANVSTGYINMTLNNSDGKYHYVASYDQPGIWTFLIKATDGSGNDRYAHGTFEILAPPPRGEPGIDKGMVVAAGGVALAGAVIVGIEPIRVFLLTLLAAPLHGRRSKARGETEIRGMIRGYVLVHPSDTYADIKRNLGLTSGCLTYHLQKLKKDGVIKSRVRGARTRYYPVEMVVPEEDGGDLYEIQKELLEVVVKDPGIPVSILAQHLGVTSQLALYHLRKLSQRRLLVLERRGIRLRVFPAGEFTSSDRSRRPTDKQPQASGGGHGVNLDSK